MPDPVTIKDLLAGQVRRSRKRLAQPALEPASSYCTGEVLFLAGMTLPAINEWKSWHWTKYSREKARWSDAVLLLCRPLVPVEVGRQCAVEVEIRFADRRRHDPDNYTPKFLLDPLVAGGKLPDDDSRVIALLSLRCTPGSGAPGTLVRLLPAPELRPSLE